MVHVHNTKKILSLIPLRCISVQCGKMLWITSEKRCSDTDAPLFDVSLLSVTLQPSIWVTWCFLSLCLFCQSAFSHLVSLSTFIHLSFLISLYSIHYLYWKSFYSYKHNLQQQPAILMTSLMSRQFCSLLVIEQVWRAHHATIPGILSEKPCSHFHKLHIVAQEH